MLPSNRNQFFLSGRGFERHEEELKELWFRDKANEMKEPTINRIDNDGHYTFKNCEFIEKGKNSIERNKRVCSKALLQYDLEGNFIKEWISAKEVQRQLNFAQGNISRCLNGEYKQCYGFKWNYE